MTSSPVPAWLAALAARAHEIPDVFPRLPPPPSDGRRSAVLILFGPTTPTTPTGPTEPTDDAVDVLLTQRAEDLRSHPGQVAFPGGAVDAGDASPEAAALREAREETGLEPDGVTVLGSMAELFLPPSGYLVTPVLAWWARPSPVAPVDPAEVARVARVPLDELLEPANRFSVRHPSGYIGPGFAAAGLFVWGFTAALLARVLTEAGLERPWDERRFESLPAMVGGSNRSAPLSPDPIAPERGAG